MPQSPFLLPPPCSSGVASSDFSEEVEKRIGPLPQTVEEFGSVEPRRRPGYKFPCYYVHIRYPIRMQDKRWPHRVIGTKEGVVKPKGHTYCRSVQEAYALAYSIAKNMDGDRQVEIRAKMSGKIKLITILRGRNGPHARKGMAVLEDIVNAASVQ